MFWAASGAGVIIAGMALLKARLVALHLAPLQEALLVSLNYALGFVLIYVLHLTIATKQPAMTASLFARTLTEVRGQVAQQKLLNEFADKVWRSQSAAILGNMLFAFATAVLIALAIDAMGGAAIDSAKAAKLLAEIDPFRSAALFYAAVAGVGLFLSGIVSGYYDNKTVLPAHPRNGSCAWLGGAATAGRGASGRASCRLPAPPLGRHNGQCVVWYLSRPSIGAFGQLAGLPLDIRHIAFAAANFGYALPILDWQLALPVVLVSIAGVMLIGLVNLSVSFSLAFYLALRATRISAHGSGQLLWRGLAAIMKAPFHWRRTAPQIKDAA